MPSSTNSANFAKSLTNPLGTTVLYSNQKSKISPTMYSSLHCGFMLFKNETIRFSRTALSSKLGMPK